MHAVYPETWFGIRERVTRGIATVNRERKGYRIVFSYRDSDDTPKQLFAETDLKHSVLGRFISSVAIGPDSAVSIPAVAELYSAGFSDSFVLLRFLCANKSEPVPFALIQSPEITL